jgi:hypothetical protein
VSSSMTLNTLKLSISFCNVKLDNYFRYVKLDMLANFTFKSQKVLNVKWLDVTRQVIVG